MSPVSNLRAFLTEKGMRARAIRSAGFTAVKFGGQNFLRLASNLVLTRLLFPEAFGIMAIVQVVLGGVAMFSDLGIRASIVQNVRGGEPDFLNTAWTIQIIRGFILGFVVFFAAGPVATFYDTPILSDILKVVAIVPVIQGFASTRLATASRNLFLGRMVGLQIGTQFVGIIVMIVLAWWLESVWALVIGSIVGPLLTSVLSHVVIPGIPNRLRLEKEALKELFNFGKYIFFTTIAVFFANQGDKAVLGKFVSLSELAIYNIAFFLASVPALLGKALDSAVMFPLYSRRPPSESESNRRKINRARFLITGVLMAGLAVLALSGDWLVRLLYDPRYHGAGPFMILITLVAMPRVIIASYSSLPLAAGHSGRFAILVTTGATLEFGFLFLGASAYGVVGVILGPLLAAILYYPLLVFMTRRYRGWDARHDAVYVPLALVLGAAVFYIHQDLLLDTLAAAGIWPR